MCVPVALPSKADLKGVDCNGHGPAQALQSTLEKTLGWLCLKYSDQLAKRDEAPRHPTYYGVPRDSAESIRLHHRAAPPGTWFHYHPHFELVMIRGSFGKRMVGRTLSRYGELDVVLLGPNLPHAWLADPLAPSDAFMDYSVVHFDRESLGLEFLRKPELAPVRDLLQRAEKGFALTGKKEAKHAEGMIERIFSTEGLERLLTFYSLPLFMARTKQSRTLLADTDGPPPTEREQECIKGDGAPST